MAILPRRRCFIFAPSICHNFETVTTFTLIISDTNEIDIDDEDDNKVDEIFQESFNDANEVYLDSE